MRGNERGKRPGAGGQIKVARERNAVVGGVGEAAVTLRHGHVVDPQRRGLGGWRAVPDAVVEQDRIGNADLADVVHARRRENQVCFRAIDIEFAQDARAQLRHPA